jgi:hypothetical protein
MPKSGLPLECVVSLLQMSKITVFFNPHIFQTTILADKLFFIETDGTVLNVGLIRRRPFYTH